MDERSALHDNLVLFPQQEYRGGFLLADPATVCTLGFYEHLAAFIAAQACPCCTVQVMRITELSRHVANLQRWLRWVTRVWGGPCHG
jgi:hypothetical protein